MDPNFDYRNLNSLAQVRTAKATLKYSIVVQEQMLKQGFTKMKTNFVGSLKQSAWRWGLKIVTGILINRIRNRKSNKRRKRS
jgi:hypothetical protein